MAQPHNQSFYASVLDYYRVNGFNPVYIPLENEQQWKTHAAKRYNLYQRHLSIPLAWLRNRSVIEFGCNSGENALVLAAYGANLILVEPNAQVLPRLETLFRQYDLEQQISLIVNEDIDTFRDNNKYDLVIAEGFLYTLPNRDDLLQKLIRLMTPGGLVIISFNDRYGCLLEITRQLLLARICSLNGIQDIQSEASLALAKRLYADDFGKLSSSRSFEVWWKDTLVNPFVSFSYLWSYPELFSLLEIADAEFYSSSPSWSTIEQHRWYKSLSTAKERRSALLENWAKEFPYFLTGIPLAQLQHAAPSNRLLAQIESWISQLSSFLQTGCDIGKLTYPHALDEYLSNLNEPAIRLFNSDMKTLYEALQGDDPARLMEAYHASSLRNLWGVPYHYLCITSNNVGED